MKMRIEFDGAGRLPLEAFGIQVTGVRGSEGDEHVDWTAMLQDFSANGDAIHGTIDAPGDFQFADKWKIQVFLKQGDGRYHPEPAEEWYTDAVRFGGVGG